MKLKGVDCTLPEAIDILLSIAIFDTIGDAKDRRKRFYKILDRLPRIAQRQTAKMLAQNRRTADLEEEFKDMARRLEPEPEIGNVIREQPIEVERRIPEPQLPPWHHLRRKPYKEVIEIHPKHPIKKFAEQSKLHAIAVECAFAVVPQSLHKSAKVEEIAIILYKQFKQWEERKNAKKRNNN
jgi:hypothetical protein